MHSNITAEMQRVERDSDLHVYVTHKSKNINQLAASSFCVAQIGIGATHGGIIFNLFHLKGI